MSRVEVETNPNTQEFRALGSEDIYSQVVGKLLVHSRVMMQIQNASTTFLNYCIRPQLNASSDVSRSIQIVWAERTWQSGSTLITTYFALRGSRPNNVAFKGGAGNLWTAEVEFFSNSLSFSSTQSAFCSSFTAKDTTAPWNYPEGGVNPVSQFSRALDVTDFEFTVDRGLKEITVLGATNPVMIPPTIRGITGNYTVVYASQSTYAEDLLTQTSGTISVVMKSGAGTATFTSCVLTGHSLPLEIANEMYEKIQFRAASMSTI